jgi:PleD family two-component response regulator
MRPQDFLAHADKALYQAKDDGRNCVRACTIPAAVM